MFRYSTIIISRHYATKPKVNVVKKSMVRSVPLITCKQTKYNLLQSEVPEIANAKFGNIPLASSGWNHYKAKSDFFIIHPTVTSTEDFSSPSSDERKFEKLSSTLDNQLISNINQLLSIDTATNIQYNSMPLIMNMNHVLIAAETGCGKTLAYLVPIVQQIIHRKNQQNSQELTTERNFNSPYGLVLTPSRELAVQIGAVAEKLCHNLGVNVRVLLGGRTKSLMFNPKFEDTDLLIGSMGAVSKLVTTNIFKMNECRHVVLDEADTLLDDSFNEKLIYFLRRFPFYRNYVTDLSDKIVATQLILAAATMPTNMEDLLQSIVDPKTLKRIVSPNLHRILPHVPQKFMRMNKMGRPMELLALIKKDVEKKRPVIVFGNKSTTSDYLSIFLNDHGIDCVNLNGDMLQKIRVGQFEKFQNGKVNVLSTTDIASRGLDTTRARHIINFDFPLYMADYIHRTGRIGRIGSGLNCNVTNFISSLREINLVQKIEHAARTMSVLPNVNANIRNIIQTRIMDEIKVAEGSLES